MIAQRMPLIRRRPAYLGIALFFAGIVTWGFWRSYFDPLLSGTVDRPWIVHLHASVFGFDKVRYRGIDKNANRLFVACGLVNLFMARRALLQP